MPSQPVIPQFRDQRWLHVSATGHVDRQSQHEPSLVVDVEGNRWWAKAESSMGPPGVYCEALAALLGAEMEAAVPRGAMAELADVGRVWLSADVGLTLPWDNQNPSGFDNCDAVGAAVALDAVLFNQDRHPGNALLTESDDASELWFIDWEAAVLGMHTARFALNPNEIPDPALKHFRGLPVRAIETGALEAAHRLAKTGPLLDQILLTCAGYARLSSQVRGSMEAVVRHRLAHAPTIVAAYLERLWGLQ